VDAPFITYLRSKRPEFHFLSPLSPLQSEWNEILQIGLLLRLLASKAKRQIEENLRNFLIEIDYNVSLAHIYM